MPSDSVQPVPPGSSPASDPDDPRLVESAREVMRALAKAVKASKMYLPEHDLCRRFRDEFATRLLRHLDDHQRLPLTVKGYEFLVGSTSVYEEPARIENLAFRCSSDGLRELVFHQGLTREELDAVLGALTAESRPLDSDIVTRLWDQGLSHVTYEVAEVQDGPETSDPGLSSLPRSAAAPGTAPLDEGPQGSTSAAPSPEPEVIPALPIEPGNEVFSLTDEEIVLLRQQVADDTAHDHVEQLIDILASILQLDDDEQSFLEVLQVLDDMVATCVRQGQFVRACGVVARLIALRDDEGRVSERSRELIRVVWTQLGSWGRMGVLEEAFNQQGAWDREALAGYLTLLPPTAADALITLLERVQTATGRRMVCDTLEAFGADGVDAMLQRLPAAPWYVARNLLHVLGELKDVRAVPALQAAMHDKEARIRREALKAIDAVGVEHLVHEVPTWLGDADEGVRLHALRLARRHPWPGLLDALSGVIADPALARRSETEQREWFDALADVGKDAALPLISRYLTPERQWPWGFLARYDPRARHAVAAARRVGTPTAAALLRQTAAQRGSVGDEARRALREMERAA